MHPLKDFHILNELMKGTWQVKLHVHVLGQTNNQGIGSLWACQGHLGHDASIERNWWIHSEQFFIGSFNALTRDSWIVSILPPVGIIPKKYTQNDNVQIRSCVSLLSLLRSHKHVHAHESFSVYNVQNSVQSCILKFVVISIGNIILIMKTLISARFHLF